jgi:hypothetical protein
VSGERERVIVVTRPEPLVDKVCPVCGAAFVGLSRQRYCSPSCAARAAYLRHAEVRQEARRQRYRVQKASQ